MGRITTVVVGGGCSGTLAASELLRNTDDDVVLVDPASRPGPGLAYGRADAHHLLNSRSSAMSALAGQSDDFCTWLAGHGLNPDPAGFAHRRDYGRYLTEHLDSVVAAHPGRFRHRVDHAVRLAVEPDGVVVEPHRGASVRADRAVLALGHGRPCRLAAVTDSAHAHPGYVHDPWRPGALDWVPDDEPVLLIGTGLTAMDVALTLAARGHRAPIHALSRRGLLPLAHTESAAPAGPPELPTELTVRALLRALRHGWPPAPGATATGDSGADWRARVDGLRPYVDQVWRALPEAEQRRFLRHAARYWEVHRHRMAPAVAATVAGLLDTGALTVRAGRLRELVPDRYYLRASTVEGDELRVATVVNCTGPGGVDRTPLGQALLADGVARRDPLRIGLEVDDAGYLVDATGQAQERVSVLGPARRGSRYWETTAVPEIRAQAGALGRVPAII